MRPRGNGPRIQLGDAQGAQLREGRADRSVTPSRQISSTPRGTTPRSLTTPRGSKPIGSELPTQGMLRQLSGPLASPRPDLGTGLSSDTTEEAQARFARGRLSRRSSKEFPPHSLSSGLEVLQDSDATGSREEQSRRQFQQAPLASPLLLGELPVEAIRPARGMPYKQEEAPVKESNEKDTVWKHIGLFKADSPKLTTRSPRLKGREAPHRVSTGFVAAQQFPSPREVLLADVAKARAPLSREHESRGLTAYFNNEPAELPRTIRMEENSRYTYSEGIAVPSEVANIAIPDGFEAHLHAPFGIQDSASSANVVPPASFVCNPEKASAQTARRNMCGGSLEDGFVKSSPAEGHRVAVGFNGTKGRQSPRAIAARAHSPPCWSQEVPRLTPGAIKAAITDKLPAYSAANTVSSLFSGAEPKMLADTPRKAAPSPRLAAPYATIEDAARDPDRQGCHSVRRSHLLHRDRLECNVYGELSPPLAIKSVMSCGSPECNRDLEDVSKLLKIAAQSFRDSASKVGSPPKATAAIADSKQVVAELPSSEQTAILEGSQDEKMRVRSSSAKRIRGDACARSTSPGGRMMLASSQKNRAATAAWCSGLRNEISDKPWVSLARAPSPSIGSMRQTIAASAAALDAGNERALALAGQKPNGSVRREIWQSSSPKQLLEVHDFIKKGCEERIEAFRQELSMLNSRNAMIRSHINAFKQEASGPCIPAIRDYMPYEDSLSAASGSKHSRGASLVSAAASDDIPLQKKTTPAAGNEDPRPTTPLIMRARGGPRAQTPVLSRSRKGNPRTASPIQSRARREDPRTATTVPSYARAEDLGPVIAAPNSGREVIEAAFTEVPVTWRETEVPPDAPIDSIDANDDYPTLAEVPDFRSFAADAVPAG